MMVPGKWAVFDATSIWIFCVTTAFALSASSAPSTPCRALKISLARLKLQEITAPRPTIVGTIFANFFHVRRGIPCLSCPQFAAYRCSVFCASVEAAAGLPVRPFWRNVQTSFATQIGPTSK